MAGDIKQKYGSANTAITITLTSLGSTSLRASTAVDNSTNLFADALVQVQIKTNAAGTSTTGYVNVYAYGTSASTYPGGISGTDAAYTGGTSAVTVIGRFPATANATTYTSNPLSVANAFGGSLPTNWGIVVENQSGAALDASVGSAWYQGILAQYT